MPDNARPLARSMHPLFTRPANRHPLWLRLGLASAALWLASCASPPPPPAAPPAPPPQPAAPPAPPPPAPVAAPAPAKVSLAASPREYRQDAARHLYQLNGERVFKGQMPPLLQAVGVVQVHLDETGHVRGFEWMRAPRHVPAVMTEIERTVRAAAPFPAAVRLGRVTYTETWLWDKSGRFQLDTLTEGQRSKL